MIHGLPERWHWVKFCSCKTVSDFCLLVWCAVSGVTTPGESTAGECIMLLLEPVIFNTVGVAPGRAFGLEKSPAIYKYFPMRESLSQHLCACDGAACDGATLWPMLYCCCCRNSCFMFWKAATFLMCLFQFFTSWTTRDLTSVRWRHITCFIFTLFRTFMLYKPLPAYYGRPM